MAKNKTYTVVTGDTLSGIASRYGTTVDDLVRLNGIPNANNISGGQVLKLPDGANSPTSGGDAAGTTSSSKTVKASKTVTPSPFTGMSSGTSETLTKLEQNAPGPYEAAPSVVAAEQALAKYEKNRPAAYQSKYQQQIDATLDAILNREKFSYDFNADPIYQQYKDQYVNLGNQAMQDTMGNAATLTGGYGNSYATTAGSQAYQAYLQRLNDVIPELYSQAYNRYRDEGQDMYNRMGLLQGLDDTDYGRYRDTVGDWRDDLNYYYTKYRDMSAEDYNRYLNNQDAWRQERSYWYQKGMDEQSQANWQTQWDYQLYQDALKAAGGSGGGGGGGNPGRKKGDGKEAVSRDTAMNQINAMIAQNAPLGDIDAYISAYYLDDGAYETAMNLRNAYAAKKSNPLLNNYVPSPTPSYGPNDSSTNHYLSLINKYSKY